MLVVVVAVFICVFLYLRRPFLFFPLNLHICSPSELKPPYSVLRIPTRFVPSSVRVRVRGPCKQWQRAGRVKKKATELAVLGV